MLFDFLVRADAVLVGHVDGLDDDFVVSWGGYGVFLAALTRNGQLSGSRE